MGLLLRYGSSRGGGGTEVVTPPGGGGGDPGGDTGGDPAGYPTLPAKWSDTLADVLGVDTHVAYGSAGGDYIYRRHGPYATENAAVIAAIQRVGARHIREQLALDRTAGGSPAQRTRIPAIVAGTGVDVLFVSAVRSLTGHPTPAQAVTEITTYHGGGYVCGIEGFNEPDNDNVSTWGQETRDYQEDLAPLVRAAGFPVLSPSFAIHKYSGTGFPGDLSAFVDVANLHIYAGGQRPSYNMDLDISLSTEMTGTGKPTWISEGGYQNALNSTQSNPKVPESVSGIYGPKNVLEAFRRGVKRFYRYELGDSRRNDSLTSREDHFGLHAWDNVAEPTWRAKPEAIALGRQQSLVADPGAPYSPPNLGVVISGGDASLRREILGRRDGTYIVALWRDVSIWTPSQTTAGTAVTVAPQTIRCTFGRARQVKVWRPSSNVYVGTSTTPATWTPSATLPGPVVDVSIAGEVVLLEVAA